LPVPYVRTRSRLPLRQSTTYNTATDTLTQRERIMKRQSYTKHMIIYLDVIGFERTVDRSRDNPARVHKIYQMLLEAKRFVNRVGSSSQPSRPFKAQMFSDTVLLTCANPDHRSLITMTRLVSRFQARMMRHRNFIRGAAVVGDHFERGDARFGPALIDAYKLERVAVWPRVLLHDSVMELATQDLAGGWWQYNLDRDEDGLTYVNYLENAFWLGTASRWRSEYEGSASAREEHLFAAHRSAVLRGLKDPEVARDSGLLAKYHSLASYHNKTLNRLCEYLPDDFEAVRKRLHPYVHTLYQGLRLEMEKSGRDDASEFLDNRFQQLCRKKDMLRDSAVDLKEAFPGFYRRAVPDNPANPA